MAIKIKAKESEAQNVPEGLYKAKLTEIEQDSGVHGDYVRLTFEITEGEYKGVTRTELASLKLSKSLSGTESKLYSIVKNMTGTPPEADEEVDIEELIGVECSIYLQDTKQKDGVQYQSVKVMPS